MELFPTCSQAIPTQKLPASEKENPVGHLMTTRLVLVNEKKFTRTHTTQMGKKKSGQGKAQRQITWGLSLRKMFQVIYIYCSYVSSSF